MAAEDPAPTPSTTSANPLMELLSAARRRPFDPDDDRPVIVFLCTGNAARSVMAAAMLKARLGENSPFIVSSGGTHVLPGQPMSVRTRRALERHGLTDPWHRSHQITETDVERASLIVAMEPMHVLWMNRHQPSGIPITGSLPRLAKELPLVAGTESESAVSRTMFDERVASLHLGDGEPAAWADWEIIVDPASGEQVEFDKCSDVISKLVSELHSAII